MSSTVVDGSEDVNDFLQRIKELGDRRDQEDEERNRKLEEEILKGKLERQARRAERARSISPTKSSPASTPTTSRTPVQSIALPPPESSSSDRRSTIGSRRDDSVDNALERLTGPSTPLDKENSGSASKNKEEKESDVTMSISSKPSPSSAMPSRNSPLPWQRRPSADHPRSRPLSMVAAENAARSPRATPTPEASSGTETTLSRDQIAQSLASKDPAWFRQTADRGKNSPAYRRNQVEDEERSHHESSSPVQLPGMSPNSPDVENSDRASNLSRYDGASEDGSVPSQSTSSGRLRSLSSVAPSISSQKLDPPFESRGLAMSPSQGRISPERLDRPVSPTKGMGGFVQSAMMKRSDSVSKRWSVQAPPGLKRGNSISSKRSSRDVPPSGQSVEESPRPPSSQSNSKIILEEHRPDTSNSMKSATTFTTNDGFVKPPLPRLQGSQDSQEKRQVEKLNQSDSTPPTSPSKTMDSKRWSPTKSSWLESALNKPESPKPKPLAVAQQQPAWMSDLSKTKRASVDLGRPPIVSRKHEVNIGGLLRSPAPGGLTQPISVGGPSPSLSSTSQLKTNMGRGEAQDISPTKYTETSEIPRARPDSVGKSTSIDSKVKPETPPKKDFKPGLKQRQSGSGDAGSDEPEFKSVFGQLRRTKTQNYVAPDPLKENITRGKASLNATGGPKKAERKDEFKDAILKKKEDFKKAQIEGKGITRAPTTGNDILIPEAIAKRQALGRSNTIVKDTEPSVPNESTASPKQPKPIPLQKEVSAPARLQGGKLADRFNPALAGLLARGPPLPSDGPRQASSTSSQRTNNFSTSGGDLDASQTGPQLTHMTKGRARGPKRKAPTQIAGTKPAGEAADPSENAPSKINSDIRTSSVHQALRGEPSRSTPTQSSSKEESVLEPSSPRKLDIKRRSQFLQEVPIMSKQSELQTTTLVAPKPLQATKIPAPEIPRKTAEMNPEVATQSPKSKPSTPSKSPELVSKAFIKAVGVSGVLPTETIKSSSIPFSPTNTNMTAKVEPEPVVSVKNVRAVWNSPINGQTTNAPRPKPPVKLPTHRDEDAAMQEAGLHPKASLKEPINSLAFRNATSDSSEKELPKIPEKFSSIGLSTPPPSSTLRPLVPAKKIDPPAQQSTEASKLLTGFFTDRKQPSKYTADTLTILSSNTNAIPTIKTLRSSLFQFSDDGKKIPVPSHQERILFEGNMYLGFHTFGNATGKKMSEVYFWVGDDVPSQVAENAEKVAEREAKNSSGVLIKITQGKETPEFVQSLGGIIIIRRGTSNKYDSLAPHILCGRQYVGQIAFDEVDYSPESLCSGFPYLISTQTGKCYLWKGKGSGIDELSCARLIGMDFGLTGEIEEIEDGSEPASFLEIFGPITKIPKSADHWRMKANYTKYHGRLFCADSAVKGQVYEISPFCQADVSFSNVYILDAFFEIYIIVGSHAQSEYESFNHALLFAQEYGILASGAEDRPFVPVTNVVLEGVPRDMKSVFRKWRDDLAPTVLRSPKSLQRGRSLRIVPLTAALEAMRN
ncbi:hypothetical protein B7463_g598, partial [Scytalidium lignicola]